MINIYKEPEKEKKEVKLPPMDNTIADNKEAEIIDVAVSKKIEEKNKEKQIQKPKKEKEQFVTVAFILGCLIICGAFWYFIVNKFFLSQEQTTTVPQASDQINQHQQQAQPETDEISQIEKELQNIHLSDIDNDLNAIEQELSQP